MSLIIAELTLYAFLVMSLVILAGSPGVLVDFIIWYAKRTPFEHIPGYMNRWWIIPYTKFPKWWRDRVGFLRWIERKMPAVRVHEILRSDLDRELHDHPWPFVSIILRGGYTEVRPKYDRSGLYTGEEAIFHGPGSILFRRSKDFHRLVLPTKMLGGFPAYEVAYTLFISFAYTQKWGYLIAPKFKQRYEEYQKAHPTTFRVAGDVTKVERSQHHSQPAVDVMASSVPDVMWIDDHVIVAGELQTDPNAKARVIYGALRPKRCSVTGELCNCPRGCPLAEDNCKHGVLWGDCPDCRH